MTNFMYPWLLPYWNRLQDARNQNRLPHALLLGGQIGMGKQHLANTFAAALLCRTPQADGRACGVCPNCLWHKAQNHPDFLHIAPEDPTKPIKVDQIRELIQFMPLTTHDGRGGRIIVLQHAENMNINAANSLLKTLEEPPGKNSTLILVAEDLFRLPMTVRSRCQVLSIKADHSVLLWLAQKLPYHSAAEIEQLLQIANGSPLIAQQLGQENGLVEQEKIFQLLQDCLSRKISASAAAMEIEKATKAGYTVLQWLISWTMDLVALASHKPAIRNEYLRNQLMPLSQQLAPERLLRILQELLQIRAKSQTPLRQDLALETLLANWTAAIRA